MESIEGQVVQWRIPTVTVKRVEERFERRWLGGQGEGAIFKEFSLGWWVVFEGSWECVYLGTADPSLKEGDRVDIIFRKVSSYAQP
jgi:hypothetical protein